jgi:hypothetical protein
LVINHRNHGWIWRHSASQTKITDFCDLDCFLGVNADRHRHRGRCACRNLGFGQNWPLISDWPQFALVGEEVNA